MRSSAWSSPGASWPEPATPTDPTAVRLVPHWTGHLLRRRYGRQSGNEKVGAGGERDGRAIHRPFAGRMQGHSGPGGPSAGTVQGATNGRSASDIFANFRRPHECLEIMVATTRAQSAASAPLGPGNVFHRPGRGLPQMDAPGMTREFARHGVESGLLPSNRLSRHPFQHAMCSPRLSLKWTA
jgi:hypothetical protein